MSAADDGGRDDIAGLRERVRVVGLGLNCQPAYQIRKFFPVAPSGFLDFLKIDEPALIWLIRNEFRLSMEERDLYHFVDGDDVWIVHRDHDIRFMHDYDRATPDAFRADVERVRAKYDHLARKWRDIVAAGEPVLFVCGDCPLDGFDAVAASLAEACPGLPYHVLLARWADRATEAELANPCRDPRVTATTVSQDRPGERANWKGVKKEWRRAFRLALREAESRGNFETAGVGAMA